VERQTSVLVVSNDLDFPERASKFIGLFKMGKKTKVFSWFWIAGFSLRACLSTYPPVSPNLSTYL
jgi:hypothetical protein